MLQKQDGVTSLHLQNGTSLLEEQFPPGSVLADITGVSANASADTTDVSLESLAGLIESQAANNILSAEKTGVRLVTEGTSGTQSAPTITTQPQSYTKQDEQVVTFTAIVEDVNWYDTVSYQWFNGISNAILVGETNPILTFTVSVADDGRQFYMRATDTRGLYVQTNTVTLTVTQIPLVYILQPIANIVNQNDNAQFIVATTGKNPRTYQWWCQQTGIMSGENTPTLTLPFVQLSDNNKLYYCVVTDGYAAASQSSTALLTVNALPVGVPDVYFVLSGGLTNTNPDLSLGGQASDTLVNNRTASLISGGITGVTHTGGVGGPQGTFTMSWDGTTGKLTTVDSTGYTWVTDLTTTGLYYSNVSYGRMILNVNASQLVSGNQTAVYNISERRGCLIDDVQYAERLAEHVNYRCIYFRNNKTTPLVNVSMNIFPQPQYGNLTLGTEFTAGTLGRPNAGYVENSQLNRGGMQYYEAYSTSFATTATDYYRGGPFLAAAGDSILSVQNSNGVNVQIPVQIADEYDSTGFLSSVGFAPELYWATIEPGKYVSIWIRREIAEGVTPISGAIIETYSLRVLYNNEV